MRHLNIETIARLIDETPSAEEATHFEECEECRTQLQAMRADRVALANLPMIEPPPTEWPELEGRLLEEGLVRRRAGSATPWSMTALRAAASVAIFAFGTMAGIAWKSGAAPASSADRTPSFAGVETSATASGAFPLVAVREPRSPEEALALYRQAEVVYLDALARVSTLRNAEAGDPRARVAALESIAAITRAALAEAPADPVLNGYHLTAIAQRDAALRQIATSGDRRWF